MLRHVSLNSAHVTFKLTYKLSCAQIWCAFVVMIDKLKKRRKKEVNSETLDSCFCVQKSHLRQPPRQYVKPEPESPKARPEVAELPSEPPSTSSAKQESPMETA